MSNILWSLGRGTYPNMKAPPTPTPHYIRNILEQLYLLPLHIHDSFGLKPSVAPWEMSLQPNLWICRKQYGLSHGLCVHWGSLYGICFFFLFICDCHADWRGSWWAKVTIWLHFCFLRSDLNCLETKENFAPTWARLPLLSQSSC